MDIARILVLIALFIQGMCWFCNIVTLFLKPHKWCELLMFAQPSPRLRWTKRGAEVFFAVLAARYSCELYRSRRLTVSQKVFFSSRFLNPCLPILGNSTLI